MKKLPDELLELICSFLDLESLVQLMCTTQRLRAVARAQLERTIHENWPWVEPSSQQAFRIVRERQKMKETDDQGDVLTFKEASANRIHTNVPVPKDALLLTEWLLPLGINMIDLRKSVLISGMSDVLPTDTINRFKEMYGERDDQGRIIVTHVTNRKVWGFALEQGDEIEETVTKMTHGDWFHALYRTDESYLVVKHKCCENDDLTIRDAPDYLITLPCSEYGEEYEIGVIFTPNQTFVVDHPLEGYEGPPSYVRLLDITTGATTRVCEIPDFSDTMVVDLWLEGPSLYIWSAIDDDEIIILDTLGGWKRRLTLTNTDDISFYDECNVRGFTYRGGSVAVDFKKGAAYKVPYEGRCITAGLVDNELHWWTFPKADELVKKHRDPLENGISIL
ncbi:hypothetical protein CJU89_6082 [Yarrowia sp. B02]|nr:hypothetical protein CJU89_6082 [Yarrowia sp. B02]